MLPILNVTSATSPSGRAEAARNGPVLQHPPPTHGRRLLPGPHHVVSVLRPPGTPNCTDATPRGDPRVTPGPPLPAPEFHPPSRPPDFGRPPLTISRRFSQAAGTLHVVSTQDPHAARSYVRRMQSCDVAGTGSPDGQHKNKAATTLRGRDGGLLIKPFPSTRPCVAKNQKGGQEAHPTAQPAGPVGASWHPKPSAAPGPVSDLLHLSPEQSASPSRTKSPSAGSF